MLGMSMSMKVCLPKRTARVGVPADRSGSRVLRTRLDLRGGLAPEALRCLTLPALSTLRSSPRNAPSRSKIEAHKTGRDPTPTAPGRHGKGDSCATELPRYPLIGGRAGSQPADQIRSAGIAGQRNGYGSRRNPAGPRGREARGAGYGETRFSGVLRVIHNLWRREMSDWMRTILCAGTLFFVILLPAGAVAYRLIFG